MRRMRRFAMVALLAAGMAAASSGIWAANAQAADIMDKIAAAKTAADHEDIAKWYDEQAKDAQAKVDEHKKMGEAYKTGGGALASKTHFHEHCEALVKSYTAQVKDYQALAAAHREMAKTAK